MPSGPAATDPALAELVATACRVLAHTGLAPNILGHVSLRTGADELLIRCRGPEERGLAFTTAADVRALAFDGRHDHDGWTAPNELPIHTSVLHARADVSAVVHAHPPAVVTTTLARIGLGPIVGAYDIVATRIAAGGIPTWERAALINTPELGDAMAAALGDRPVVALYGHGLVSVGHGEPERAVAQAVVNAAAVDALARMTLAVLAAGGTPEPISDADQAQLPDLGPGLNVMSMWRHLVTSAEAATATLAPHRA